jgi:hypothetical protein
MVSHDYYLNFGVIRYIFAFYSGGRRQEIGWSLRARCGGVLGC